MDRRTFLKNTTYASLLPFLGSAIQSCSSFVQHRFRTLVIVQLVGGNDGLNTLIPLDNYTNLVHARPNLYIPEEKVLALPDTQVGLHPSLSGLRDLYDAGLVSFIQGVGYENSSYSHFRSTDIWLTGADASKTLYTGWIGRYLESSFDGSRAHPPAIKVGESGSLLFEGYRADMSIVVAPTAEEYVAASHFPLSDTLGGYARRELEEIQATLKQSAKYAPVLDKAIKASQTHTGSCSKVEDNELANELAMVVRLLHAGLQTPVYHVELNGFDTHSEQADVHDRTKGMHADLLRKLSEGLVSFWNDITQMGKEEEVLVMVFSEFGRRIKANDSNGTDHGSAQPLLFLGKGLKPGIQGHNPIIPAQVSVGDNLAVQTDFRSVYADVLKEWFLCDAQKINQVLDTQVPTVNLFA